MAGNTWGNWRVNLPTHTGDLQPTDLIECTSIVGGLPVNSAITGAQIIAASGGATWGGITGTLSTQTDLQSALTAKQATLVSGTNIKTVNGTSLLGTGDIAMPYTLIGNQFGTAVTGTTSNVISATQVVNGSTLSSGNVLQVRTKIHKTAGTTSSAMRMYLNTTNSLTGATLIAAAGTQSSIGIQSFWRDFLLIGTSLYCYSPLTAISSDITSGTVTLVTYNPSTTYYLLFTVQNSATADSVNFIRTNVMKYA